MTLCQAMGRFQFSAATAAGQGRRTCRWMLVAAGLFLGLGAAQANDRWLTNYEHAMAAAEETGRPVLSIFTGSDWCPHCVTLEKNVLDSDAFLSWAEDRVVLLMVDLPQQGISQEERQARSRVCIKYGVRTFPNTVLIAPDGAKIMGQSGYHGQTPEVWLAAMEKHVPAPALAEKPVDHGQILSSIDTAVKTGRDSRRPVLLLVSRPEDLAAKTRVSTLIEDPEFRSLAKDNFVVARVPPRAESQSVQSGGEFGPSEVDTVPMESVEVIVTEDGETPIHSESGSQPATRIVSGLRRFLSNRQATRQAEARR